MLKKSRTAFPAGFVPTASFDYIAVNNAVASGVYMAKVNSANGTLQIYSNSAQSNGNIRAHGVFVIAP